MSKTPREKLNERVFEIQEIVGQISELEERLARLVGLSEKTSTSNLPQGMNLMEAIKSVFQENPTNSLQIKEVVTHVERKFSTKVDRKVVQSTLQYLATNKKFLEKVAQTRGVYKIRS